MNKNARLQLKGRIFMTNVTEVVSLGKQGIILVASIITIFNSIQAPIRFKFSGKEILALKTS
jgi:hypothetical protein